ncbi:MAG: coproporphyrinogen III oxidase [Alphaproteobacteria bacterium]|nr:coproporphyrinogen III oxidase [Alphaproteobacteria bacterium]MCW5741182.1 coproporphyrinogen III oxidase [Alphaproteobacteria bacterium]
MNDARRQLGVYVHWPFCVSKCPYCDFNSHVRDGVDQTRWREALLAELAHYAKSTTGRRVDSVFFGGGTPSLMPPATIAAVIGTIRDLWPLAGDVEITMEANPTSVEAARFEAVREAGVNRVSLGVQALDPGSLRFLGRAHSVDEGLAAIATARAVFARYSFDLIYARPGQTPAAWRAELTRALELAGEHLSLYQLTLERGTRFWQDHAHGAFAMPDEDTAAVLYEETGALMAAHGLPAYEISNYARQGAACRHNLIYWRYEDYVGVGPGAHGRFAVDRADTARGKRATRQASGPEAWLEQVEARGHATAEDRLVDRDEMPREALMMGLRLVEGIDRGRFRALTGRDPLDAIDSQALSRLIEGGFLALDAERLRATAAGRQRLDAVLARLLR